MSFEYRLPWIKLVMEHPNLTRRQKDDIRNNVVHPLLHAADAAIGMAITFACRLNMTTTEGKAMLEEDRR